MNVQHSAVGDWRIETHTFLTDEEAGAITFRAAPSQLQVGQYVEVQDSDGLRIDEVSSVTLERDTFGQRVAVAEIELS